MKTHIYPVELDYVVDGDTVRLKHLWLTPHLTNHDINVRLEGIDAPEIFTGDEEEQEQGYESKHHLEDLLEDRELRFEWIERGKYGRAVGILYRKADGVWEDVGEKMVQDGHADWSNG